MPAPYVATTTDRNIYFGGSLGDFFADPNENELIVLGDAFLENYWRSTPLTSGITWDGISFNLSIADTSTLTQGTTYSGTYVPGQTVALGGVPYVGGASYERWNDQWTIDLVTSSTSLRLIRRVYNGDVFPLTGSPVLYMSNQIYSGESVLNWLQNDYRIKHRFLVREYGCERTLKAKDLIGSLVQYLDRAFALSLWSRYRKHIAPLDTANPKKSYHNARILICAGLQDILAGDTADNVIAYYKAFLSINKWAQIDICTIPPTWTSAITTAQGNSILQVNNFIRSLPRFFPRVMVHDVYAWLVDNTSTLMQPKSAYWGYPGEVPTSVGARYIAQQMAANYAAALSLPADSWANSHRDNYTVDSGSMNKLKNPLMLGSGGGGVASPGTAPSGTIPASYTIYNLTAGQTISCATTARTVLNDGDTYGNNLVMTIASAASSSLLITNPTLAFNGCVPGRKYVARFHVQGSGLAPSAATACNFYLTCGSSTGRLSKTGWAIQAGATGPDTVNEWLQTEPFVWDGGVADQTLISIDLVGAHAAAIIKIGRGSIEEYIDQTWL